MQKYLTEFQACGVVSAWTWAATLLQSSTVAYQFGISGPFWCRFRIEVPSPQPLWRDHNEDMSTNQRLDLSHRCCRRNSPDLHVHRDRL